jgi:predicted secreted protein
MKNLLFVLFLSVLSFSVAAFADDDVRFSKKSSHNENTIVTVAAEDQKTVQQDLLVASLRIERDGKDSKVLQDEINKIMASAMDLAKQDAALKVSTGNYYVYSYDPNPSPRPLSHAEQQKRMIWKGSQTIELQSKDAQKVLDVVGKIQDLGLVMNGLNYTLSSELQEAQKDELLVGALQKIQKKAELIAKTLGKTGYDILEVNVEGANMPQPQPVMMMKAMGGMARESDAMAAPVAAPGEAEVSLSVSARVVLNP